MIFFSLAEFVDTFGARMSCTDNLNNATDYMLAALRSAGLENVHTENASVPDWDRGLETAELLLPHKQRFSILGLGSSIGTPRGGIEADVIAVDSFDEFDRLPETSVRGKIVLFVPVWESYGKTVAYRRDAASVASRKGAVAALIRSITPFSIGTPHTGSQYYQEGVQKIPVAALTVEDAEMLLRIHRRGILTLIKNDLHRL